MLSILKFGLFAIGLVYNSTNDVINDTVFLIIQIM